MPRIPAQVPFLLLVFTTLIFGLWAGLSRLGWVETIGIIRLPVSHGPLMISGFLGTLIGLERAVALQKRWVYLSPFLCGLGGLTLIIIKIDLLSQSLITLSSVILLIAMLDIVKKQFTDYTVILTLGTLLWLLGNILWVTNLPIYRIVYWWIGFLVLTIASERLELSKIQRLSGQIKGVFIIIISVYLLALILSLHFLDIGIRFLSLATITLAVWLIQNDIARKTVKQNGLPRYAAVCMLSGYIWLAISGALGLIYGAAPAGLKYDAVLHSVLLGFVFSMIFGHAIIIFPTILNKQINYSPILYVNLVFLHGSLFMRISGDITILPILRKWGGLLNEVAVIIFVVTIALIMHRPLKPQARNSIKQINHI